MKDLLFEKSLPAYLDYFHLSPKKLRLRRLLWSLLSFLLYFLVVTILIKNAVFFLGLPIAFYLGWKIPYLQLRSMKKRSKLIASFMFPQFVNYFLCLSETEGNVYQTIVATIPFLSDPLKTEVQKLAQGLKDSSNDRQYYMDFANFIGTTEAIQVMGMIYDFSEHGISKSELRELEELIDDLTTNKWNEFNEREVGKMEKFADPPITAAMGFVITFVLILLKYYFSHYVHFPTLH